jgi:hypothetical protein
MVVRLNAEETTRFNTIVRNCVRRGLTTAQTETVLRRLDGRWNEMSESAFRRKIRDAHRHYTADPGAELAPLLNA